MLIEAKEALANTKAAIQRHRRELEAKHKDVLAEINDQIKAKCDQLEYGLCYIKPWLSDSDTKKICFVLNQNGYRVKYKLAQTQLDQRDPRPAPTNRIMISWENVDFDYGPF